MKEIDEKDEVLEIKNENAPENKKGNKGERRIISTNERIREHYEAYVEEQRRQNAAISNYLHATYPSMEGFLKVSAEISAGIDAVSHFYLSDSTGYFNDLKNGLREIKKMTAAFWQASGKGVKKPTKKDLLKIYKKIEEEIKDCTGYLTEKTEQFEADIFRKNSSGKKSNEQARIRAVVKSLDKLMEMKYAMAGYLGMDVNLPVEREARKNLVGYYQDVLVSGTDDKVKMQKDSHKNRLVLDRDEAELMDALEGFFGTKPKLRAPFNGEMYDDLVKKKNGKSPFDTITKISDVFPAIGNSYKGAKLSNKDFSALSFAMLSSKDLYRLYEEKNFYKYDGLMKKRSFEDRYLFSCRTLAGEFASGGGLGDHLSARMPYVELSRQMTKEVLQSYQRGNKLPLAKLITESLQYFVVVANESESYLPRKRFTCYAEMGKRMQAMLERDPELMKLAVKEGLRSSDLKNLNSMAREGHYHQRDYLHGESEQVVFDDQTKEEFYTDMVMNKLNKLQFRLPYEVMGRDKDYKTEFNHHFRKAVREYLTENFDAHAARRCENLYSSVSEMDEACNQFKKAMNAAEKIQNDEQMKQAKEKISDSFYREAMEFNRTAFAYTDNFEEKLLKKYKNALGKKNFKNLKKHSLAYDTLVEKALELEQKRIYPQGEKKAPSGKVAQADVKAFDQYKRYMDLIDGSPEYIGVCQNYATKLSEKLFEKYGKHTPYHRRHADMKYENEMRGKIKVFLKEEGHLQLNTKQFIDKLQNMDVVKGKTLFRQIDDVNKAVQERQKMQAPQAGNIQNGRVSQPHIA